MSEFDLSEVIRVTQYESIDDTNKLLEAGWVLLRVFTHRYEDGAEKVIYVLGWPRSAGEPIDPLEDARKEQEAGKEGDLEDPVALREKVRETRDPDPEVE